MKTHTLRSLISDPNHDATTSPKPAGFWIRGAALLMDNLVLGIPLGLLGFVALSTKNLPLLVVVSIPGIIYKPFMESYFGATLGKMACRLRVIDANGENLPLRAAYVRFLPFLLGQLTGWLCMILLFWVPEFKDASGYLQIAELMARNPLRPLNRLLNLVIFCDCVTVAFTNRKRALHDMMAGSFCIQSDDYSG